MKTIRDAKTGRYTKILCRSWISGKHSDTVEVNTSLSYIDINGFFAQGEDADNYIDEINYIYNTKNCTPLEACNKWHSRYF